MKNRYWKLTAGILGLIMALSCILATAAAETKVSLSEYLPYEGGKTTVSWDVSGSDPGSYKVYSKVINNGTVEQPRRKLGTTFGHSLEISECIPGKSYEITLTDANDNVLDQKWYQMDDVEKFEDGKLKDTSVKITMEFRRTKDGKSYSRLKALKAQDILAGFSDFEWNYGMKYQMRMPQLAKSRTFYVTLAFEAPNGYLYVENAGDVTFERVNRGYQTLWWNLAGYSFFFDMYLNTRDIPVGEYTVYLLWDGRWMNTSKFRVT